MKTKAFVLIASFIGGAFFSLHASDTYNHVTVSGLQTDNIKTEASVLKHFDIRAGFMAYCTRDQDFYGHIEEVHLENGSKTTCFNGSGTLTGPTIGFTYFFNNNFGLSAELNPVSNKREDDTRYLSFDTLKTALYSAESHFTFYKLGATGRISGAEYPFKIKLTAGLGWATVDVKLKKEEFNNDQLDFAFNVEGRYGNPMFFIQNEVAFPIYRSFYIFGQFEYVYFPFKEIKLADRDAYIVIYKNVNLGGSAFKIGLGFEF
ncbi:MAG: hypothetical protein JXB24_05535 [Bacteroidales bacterium]|nr:hypothetical protein [Bacteroidales bacterium]